MDAVRIIENPLRLQSAWVNAMQLTVLFWLKENLVYSFTHAHILKQYTFESYSTVALYN